MGDVIDHFASYLNDKDTANTLENYLEQQIQKTLKDQNYRIQLGSKTEFWILFKKVIEKLIEKDCLVNVLKLARNVVAGDLNNQLLAQKCKAVECIQDKLRLEAYDQTSDNNILLQVGTQAVCNLITNTNALDSFWQDWMFNENKCIWHTLLSRNIEGLITSVLVLIINCTKESKSRCHLMIESNNGRKIIASIAEDLEKLHENCESKNFELGCTIFSELFVYGYFKPLYNIFKSNGIAVNGRQIILLKILDSKIHAAQNFVPKYINTTDIKFICEKFETTAKDTVNVIVSVKESSETTSNLQVEHVSDIYMAIILLLEILNQLLVLEANELKKYLVDINTIFLVTDILGHLQALKLPPAQDDRPEVGFNFLKRECVRMIGSLCYKDNNMQNKIRELGGVPLVLDQLKIDDSNPYLREYATLALRNIMENNVENQNIIRQLEPEQVLQTDELTRLGITPKLLKDGKLKINKTEL